MMDFKKDAVLKDVRNFPGDLQYSQSTYYGRFMHFFTMTNPRTLFTTTAQLKECEDLLRRVQKREKGWESITIQQYIDAQRRHQAIVHPESGRPIFWPFRFAAFIPMNFINLCGMLAPSSATPARAMFWQLSNQTYNVGFNYCNGSGKDGLSPQALFGGYVVATTTACGLSYGLNKLAGQSAAGGPPALWRMFIPYTAVAAANLANLATIRLRDLYEGIVVRDPQTQEPLADGTPSPRAGRLAVAQVALSRVLIPVPLMLLPPVLMDYLFNPKTGLAFFRQHRAKLYVPVNVATLVAVLSLALPLSIAIFPQETRVPMKWLEPRYQGLKRAADGKLIEEISFNKGL